MSQHEETLTALDKEFVRIRSTPVYVQLCLRPFQHELYNADYAVTLLATLKAVEVL